MSNVAAPPTVVYRDQKPLDSLPLPFPSSPSSMEDDYSKVSSPSSTDDVSLGVASSAIFVDATSFATLLGGRLSARV